MTRLLPWTILIVIYTMFSGESIEISGARPAVFLAFVTAVSFRNYTVPSMALPFLLLLSIRAAVMLPDSRGDLLSFAACAVAVPAAGRFLQVHHYLEYFLYSAAVFISFFVMTFIWSKIIGKDAPLPGFAAMVLALAYSLVLSSAFFLILPHQAAGEQR
jgi:hypothetical protein